MNDAGDGDNQEADDDGGHRHVQRHPAQPPGAVVVPPRVAAPGLDESRRRLDVSLEDSTLSSANKSSCLVSVRIWETILLGGGAQASRQDCSTAVDYS